MDQAWSRRLADNKTTFTLERLTLQQLLEQRLTLTDGDDGSLRQRTAELFVKDTDGSTTQNSSGLRLKTARPFQTLAHQPLIASQFTVVTGHQAETTKRSVKTLQRVG